LEIAMRTAEQPAASAPAAEPQPYTIVKRAMPRWWEVRDPAGDIVCLTVYRRGAHEVVRRLSLTETNA
jgi:hypothetical protein